MILHCAMRPADDTTAEAHTWDIDTPDYDAGLLEARASVPEGWQLLHVQVDR